MSKETKQYAEIRIDVDEVKKLSESLFETLLLNFHVIITENGKDQAVSLPLKEYEMMCETVKKTYQANKQ